MHTLVKRGLSTTNVTHRVTTVIITPQVPYLEIGILLDSVFGYSAYIERSTISAFEKYFDVNTLHSTCFSIY